MLGSKKCVTKGVPTVYKNINKKLHAFNEKRDKTFMKFKIESKLRGPNLRIKKFCVS